MIVDQFALPAIIAAAIAGGIIVIAQIAAVFIYDAGEVKYQRALRAHPHARANRSRPLITVLVSSHNDMETISYTLNSILQGSYRNVEIIVVDHASTDMTKRIVKGYVDMHPKQSIRLVSRQHRRGRDASLVRAVKRYGSGRLVVALPAGSYLYKDALVRVAQHFAYDASLQAVNCNEQIGPVLNIPGLFEKYQALLGRRSDKFLSAAGWMSDRGSVSMCRADVFGVRTPKLHVRYAHDVIVIIPALASYVAIFVHAYRRSTRLLRSSMGRRKGIMQMGYSCCTAFVSMSGPLLAAYFLYIALYLHEPTLLLLVVAGLSAFLLLAIGEAGQLKPWQKAAYAFGMPMTYVLFYLLSFSRLFAAVTAPFAKRLTDERRTV